MKFINKLFGIESPKELTSKPESKSVNKLEKSYKCDACSSGMASRDEGKSYPSKLVCTCPAYWKLMVSKVVKQNKMLGVDVDGDNTYGLFVQSMVQNNSSFLLCPECASIISRRDEQLTATGLRELMTLGIGERDQVLVVAGVVWQTMAGRWPACFDRSVIKMRDKVQSASAKPFPGGTSSATSAINARTTKPSPMELFNAVKDNDLRLVNELLLIGADVDAKASDDMPTVLMAAAYQGNVDIVKTLLAKGANVNAVSNCSGLGMTVLMFAAMQPDPVIVKLLLDKGANVNAKTKNGATALFSATDGGHHAIVALLRAAGARD